MIQPRKNFGEKKKSELSSFEKESLFDYKRRFSIWHSKQIDSLSFSINLLFTITLAALGFVISNQKTLFTENTYCLKNLLIKVIILLLAVSASIGLLGLIVRLNDIRLTKDKIFIRKRIFELNNKIKYEAYEPSDKEYLSGRLDNLIWWTKGLGKVTWIFFYIQLLLLSIAFWILVLNI